MRAEDKIKVAGMAEYPGLVEIWRRSVGATHDFLAPSHFKYLCDRMLIEFLPRMGALLEYERHGAAAGFIGFTANYVGMLFVEPEFMRQGIGSALLDRCRALAGPLQIEVNEQNQGALTFYMSQGFAITGRLSHDHMGWPYPLLCMKQKA